MSRRRTHGSPPGAFFPFWQHRLSQEVKNMRQRKLPARISRRLGAALLAGVTLWTVSVTAGSTDAAGAWQALKREIPVALLRWQLGDPGQSDGLSAAAVLTLSQSPLLFSARQEIAGLRQQTEETPEETVPAPVTQPVQEEPRLRRSPPVRTTAYPPKHWCRRIPAAIPSAAGSISAIPPSTP